MSIEENTSVPTPLESARYFSALPALDHEGQAIVPRALILSDDGDIGANTDNQAEVNIDKPAVIGFADNVSKENRDAIMLGVQFAEVVASKKHDIDIDPINYLKSYAEAFSHAGWTLAGGGSEYAHEKTSHKSVTMDSLVMELLSSIAGPNAAAVLQMMNITLEKLQKNEPLMQLFERNAAKGRKTNFRMVPCLQSEAGTPITYLLAMDIESSSSSGGALFWKWKVSNLSIKRLAKGMQFNRSAFNRGEPLILEYLGVNRENYFKGLPK